MMKLIVKLEDLEGQTITKVVRTSDRAGFEVIEKGTALYFKNGDGAFLVSKSDTMDGPVGLVSESTMTLKEKVSAGFMTQKELLHEERNALFKKIESIDKEIKDCDKESI